MTRHVLLLDDDTEFCQRMTEMLARHDVKAICPTLSPEAIATALQHVRIVGIFADAFLEGGRTIGPLLAATHSAYPTLGFGEIPIWIITGAGEDEDPVGMIREDTSGLDIQDHWFGKPVRVNHMLQVLPTTSRRLQFKRSKVAPNFDWMTLPVRVLDTEGVVVHVNHHWKGAANRPDPHDFIPFDKAPPHAEFWGAVDRDDETGSEATTKDGKPSLRAFRLHSFQREGYLVQVGHPISGAPDTDFKAICDHIASALDDVGFTRCRVYRLIQVPGCGGIMRLDYCNHDLPGDDSGLKQHPIPDRLSTMLGPVTDLPAGTLRFDICTKDEEARIDDASIRYWRDNARGNDVRSWVEIPVYVAEYGPSGKMVYRPRAMLSMDRLGQREAVDGSPEEVDRRQIDKINVTLRRMLRDLATQLRSERIEDERKWREAIDKVAPDIQEATSVQAIAGKLLGQAMIQVKGKAKATSGLIAWAKRQGGQLEILDHTGRKTSPHLSLIPPGCQAFPVMRCWKTKEPVFLPDWRNSPDFAQVQAIPDDELLRFDPGNGHRLREFFNGFGSIIVLPIMAGTEIRGALSLKHTEPWFFTADKVAALRALIEHTSWALAAAEERVVRQAWELTVAHEIRSDAAAISESLNALDTGCVTCSSTESRHDLQVRSLHLLDLANALMTVLGKGPDNRGGIISAPLEVLRQALSYASDSMRSRRQQLVWRTAEYSPQWHHALTGLPEMLARVLRVLLENASRHGESDGEIGLSCSLNEREWTLTIDNPGILAAEIPETSNMAVDGNRMRIDMHVGLSASRCWVEHLGGSITLRQSTDQPERVEAILRWPLAATGEKYT